MRITWEKNQTHTPLSPQYCQHQFHSYESKFSPFCSLPEYEGLSSFWQWRPLTELQALPLFFPFPTALPLGSISNIKTTLLEMEVNNDQMQRISFFHLSCTSTCISTRECRSWTAPVGNFLREAAIREGICSYDLRNLMWQPPQVWNWIWGLQVSLKNSQCSSEPQNPDNSQSEAAAVFCWVATKVSMSLEWKTL